MLFDFFSDIVPKALLPISVLLLGFGILAVSLFLTKVIMKLVRKISEKKK